MRTHLLTVFLLLAVAEGVVAQNANPAFEPFRDDPVLPRVLLIGDSISIGYTLPVRKELAGKANVHRIPENGGPTTNGLAKVERWLGSAKWDVIHFNWGLHDLKQGADGARQVPLEQYEKNLRELVARLKRTGAIMVWAATTPVPEGKLNPPRTPADVIAYNAAARRVMEENGVRTDDLYGAVLPHQEEWQLPANVHFKPAGYEALGKRVAASIRAALNERK